MKRSNRLFEIIQILRSANKPVTATELSDKLEVSKRTVYRDIAALQAMQTPIDGEAGIGYMMRSGYNLPPLNFDLEEVEALRVGLMLLSRTGDSHLQKAAARIVEKVEALHGPTDWLQVSPWGAPKDDPERGCVSFATLRAAIRNENKLEITYRDEDGADTVRIIRPVVMFYHQESVLLASWCEKRAGFRHFRTDRIYKCVVLDDQFSGEGQIMRKLWLETNELARSRIIDG